MKRNLYTILILLFFCFTASEIYSQYYFNQYASFDGNDDYLSAPSHNELSLDSAFTIEVWVYLKDSSGFNKTIISNVNAANNSGYSILIKGSSSNPGNAGRLQFNINGANTNVSQTAGTKIPLNIWTHLAFTFKDLGGNNSDSIKFFINGLQVVSLTRLVEPFANTTDSLRIGNCYLPGDYSNSFKGYIDDLRIYKTRHTIQQIANDRGVPISMDEISNINLLSNSRYSSLSAAWVFNGNGNDNVGIKNNLTSVNGVSFINANFNPVSYKNQSNYFIKLNGQSWLSAPDSVNSTYDADSAITLEAYVYPDTVISSSQTLISKGNNYKLGILSNKFFFSINSGSKAINSLSNVIVKNWNHVAATYRAGTGEMNIYVNGVLDSSKIFTSGNISMTNDSLFMGKSLTGEYLFGKLDEVRISRNAKQLSIIRKYLFENIDYNNGSQFQPLMSCYGFEGNTLDNVTRSKPMLIRGDANFEWINNGSGAGQSSQSPLLRTSEAAVTDTGYFHRSSKSFSIKNNTVNRDSVYVPFNYLGPLTEIPILLNHTYMDDVDISLRAPNGVTVNLSSDFGNTLNDMLTTFQMSADSSMSDQNAPFSMKIKPQSSLSVFTGSSQGYWRITVTDDNAANIDSGRVYMWGVKFSTATGISQNTSSLNFNLSQNFPNPFNPETKIKYEIGKKGNVELNVYNNLGKEVVTLVSQIQDAGYYEVVFNSVRSNNGISLPSGIYFYSLKTENYTETKRMILLK